jgi:hypothetical protein
MIERDQRNRPAPRMTRRTVFHTDKCFGISKESDTTAAGMTGERQEKNHSSTKITAAAAGVR